MTLIKPTVFNALLQSAQNLEAESLESVSAMLSSQEFFLLQGTDRDLEVAFFRAGLRKRSGPQERKRLAMHVNEEPPKDTKLGESTFQTQLLESFLKT